MTTRHIPLRVVFYREDLAWVAHCLEFDLLGHGQTKEVALKCLTDAIGIQFGASLHHENYANLFSPAPGEFYDMFACGKNIAVGNISVCIDDLNAAYPEPCVVEELAVREYSGTELEPA